MFPKQFCYRLWCLDEKAIFSFLLNIEFELEAYCCEVFQAASAALLTG